MENQNGALNSAQTDIQSSENHINSTIEFTDPSNPTFPTGPPQQSQTTFGSTLRDAGAWVKDYGTALKHGSIKPYCLTERKTRAATRNQPWGPLGAELNELARLSQNPTECSIIFRVLDLRLAYPPEKWRNVYKALSVIEFLSKRGSNDAVNRAKAFLPRLQYLESFAYITPDSRDVGSNVRHRAGVIKALLQDDKRLQEERDAALRQHARMGTPGSVMVTNFNNNNNLLYNNTGNNLNTSIPDQKNDENNNDRNEDDETVPSTAHLPNAGETKGVSQQDNARHIAALKRLLARPENHMCADCAVPGTGHRPTWASISLGVFICMRCAGVHRGLGVHISQVRSCSLDTWLASQVEFMAGCGGNIRANAYWESGLPTDEQGKRIKPSMATLADLNSFIRRKYEYEEFTSKDTVWPPEPSYSDSEIVQILEDMLPEEERAAAVQARLAAEEEEAKRRAEEAEEEAEREREREREAQAAAAAAAAAQVDLINLLDFDVDNGCNDGAQASSNGVHSESHQHMNNHQNSNSTSDDPFAALESVFSPTSTTTAQQNETTVKSPLDVSNPPPSFDAWDMGAILAAQKAKAAQEEEERRRKAAAEEAAAAAQAAAQVYRPPWAPGALTPPPSSTGMMHSNGGGQHAVLSLTAGPVDSFQEGFQQVPHLYTTNPFAPPAQAPLPPGMIPLTKSTPATNTTTTNSMTGMKKTPSEKMNRPLLPHERRAQELMMNGLDSFNAHASLVAVKLPSPMSGKGAIPQNSPSMANNTAHRPNR